MAENLDFKLRLKITLMCCGGKMYDILIIGTGPAGLTVALYAARYNLKTLCLGATLGGTAAEAWKVENFPGFSSISGLEFCQKVKSQAETAGAEIMLDEVTKISQEKSIFSVETKNEKNFQSRAIVLALGTQRRKLGVKGEEEFLGKGVAYCVTCDAVFFKGKTVAMVGGGDSAIKGAMLLAQYAKKVYLMVRGAELQSEPKNIEAIKQNQKMEIIYNTEIAEILGQQKVSGVLLKNGQKIDLDGVFIEIGGVPPSALAKNLQVDLDDAGYIKVDQFQKTNIPRIFAAGDITNLFAGFKQIVAAASQGAVAAFSAYQDLKKNP